MVEKVLRFIIVWEPRRLWPSGDPLGDDIHDGWRNAHRGRT